MKEINVKKASLEETIEPMMSDDYKTRFVAEYCQVAIRYERLKTLCKKIEIAELGYGEMPDHKCPISILRDQLYAMAAYIEALEKRALVEDIALS